MESENEKRLEELLEGNRRFFEERCVHPRSSAARRRELTGGQKPFAVVVACSDSRVPPEILFDLSLIHI